METTTHRVCHKPIIKITRKGDRLFGKCIAKISKSEPVRSESHFCYISKRSAHTEQKNELKQRKVTGSLNW